MNIFLILSTLVIGASTMDSPGNNPLLLPQIAAPTSDAPLPTNPTEKKTQTNRGAQKDTLQHNAQRSQITSRSSSLGRSQQADNVQPVMPTAPTDNSAGAQAGQTYQWLPPTVNPSSAGSAGSGGLGSTDVPTSPTRARPGMSQSYSSMQNAEQQNRRSAAAQNSAAATPQISQKAFTGYSQPSSGTSPYMNLFRSDNASGTINNYSTLVRPELDQQRANQKFGSDIHGLENSTHVQGLSIRQLNRETQSLQGVNATQYFMNYGDYYPGAR